MSMLHSFDTHAIVKSGMKTDLAETVVKAISASRDTDFSHLATKADLIQVKAELSAEIEKVRGEIKDVKSDILKWFIGMNIATV